MPVPPLPRTPPSGAPVGSALGLEVEPLLRPHGLDPLVPCPGLDGRMPERHHHREGPPVQGVGVGGAKPRKWGVQRNGGTGSILSSGRGPAPAFFLRSAAPPPPGGGEEGEGGESNNPAPLPRRRVPPDPFGSRRRRENFRNMH